MAKKSKPAPAAEEPVSEPIDHAAAIAAGPTPDVELPGDNGVDPAPDVDVDQAADASAGDEPETSGQTEPDPEPKSPEQIEADDAQAAYDDYLQAAAAFERESIKIERDWHKEILERRAARKVHRQQLLDRKRQASVRLQQANEALATANRLKEAQLAAE